MKCFCHWKEWLCGKLKCRENVQTKIEMELLEGIMRGRMKMIRHWQERLLEKLKCGENVRIKMELGGMGEEMIGGEYRKIRRKCEK